MKRTVVVTGANGFVGRYVTRLLADMNYQVVGLARSATSFFHNGYIHEKVDICQKEHLCRIFEKYNNIVAIVHLAADISVPGNDKSIRTNVLGTSYLAQCALQYDIRKVINLSSIPVIGTPLNTPIDEMHIVNPQTIYHLSKYAGEQILNILSSKEIQVVNLRIPSPIGVGMKKNNFLSMLLNRCIGNEIIEIYGHGLRVQNYIDVRDVAYAVVKGLEYSESDLFLIAGQSIANIELVQLCKEMTKSDAKIIIGEHVDLEENNKWIVSGEKARNMLGFEPQYSLKESLKWIIEGR